MNKLKLTILLLLFVPNIALAQNDTPVRRTIEDITDQPKIEQPINSPEENGVYYGLAAVVLAVVAIFAFNSLMKDSSKHPKKNHDR